VGLTGLELITTEPDFNTLSQSFQVTGCFEQATRIRSGHIHDTYVGNVRTPGSVVRYIYQNINTRVFKDPEKLMDNIERVTAFARQQIQKVGGNPDRETLTLIPARDGRSYVKTQAGEYWRMYAFIEGAHTYEVTDNLRTIYSAARSFGNFQRLMDCLPGARLHETIPNFHYTPSRYEAFEAAVAADQTGRAREVAAEIDFIRQRRADTSVIVDLLAQGHIPERVTHNDTKLNNVLIDDGTGEGVCVIALDTVRPGSFLYDFGDLVRMGAATAVEDEADLAKVEVDLTRFEWLVRGYLDAACGFLTPLEWSHLVFSARLITLEQGIRFLTDYLNGDTYYKVEHALHNLDRTRNQLKMVADMEHKKEAMEAVIRCYRAMPCPSPFDFKKREFPNC
jgi:hypothetical protein